MVRFFSNPGSKVKPVYEPFIADSGARKLRHVGDEDLDAFIQSFKLETDINVIIKRFQLGDASVLSAQKGMYGDFTGAPKSLSDFLNAQIQANLIFDKLPADVRNAFDCDVNKFFMTYGSPEWMKIVSPFIKPASEPSKEVT